MAQLETLEPKALEALPPPSPQLLSQQLPDHHPPFLGGGGGQHSSSLPPLQAIEACEQYLGPPTSLFLPFTATRPPEPLINSSQGALGSFALETHRAARREPWLQSVADAVHEG